MSLIDFKLQMATDKQVLYIQQLSDDLGFTTHQRNAHIREILKIPKQQWSKAPADLTKAEASQVINKFKEWKEHQSDS